MYNYAHMAGLDGDSKKQSTRLPPIVPNGRVVGRRAPCARLLGVACRPGAWHLDSHLNGPPGVSPRGRESSPRPVCTTGPGPHGVSS